MTTAEQPPSAPRTARALAREQITAQILSAARARLTREGPGELSLRAVARDVGMVSSAVYRYYASRDELLTALLMLAYDELGAAAEAADAAVGDRTDGAARWLAVCRAVRGWAREHPGDYALLYGSPVPGYVAPGDTVAPASRVILVLARIWFETGTGAQGAAVPASVVADAIAVAERTGFAGDGPSPGALVDFLCAWSGLFGLVSFELFGHFVGSVSDADAFFDVAAMRLAHPAGIA